MSHVSALPTSKPGLDETAVQAAHYALQAFSFSDVQDIDAMDAAVGVIGFVAVARIVYLAAKHPSSVGLLQRVLFFLKKVKK